MSTNGRGVGRIERGRLALRTGRVCGGGPKSTGVLSCLSTHFSGRPYLVQRWQGLQMAESLLKENSAQTQPHERTLTVTLRL